MEKDDEMWLKKMREMLIEYDEPAPPLGWEKLQRELYSPVERRIIPKRFWAAAAAVLILAVSGISFYFLHSPVAEDIRLTSTPEVNVVPDVIPTVPVLENKTSRVEPVDKMVKSPKSFIAHVSKATKEQVAVPNVEEEPETKEPISAGNNDIISDQNQDVITDKQPETKEPDNGRKMARPSGKDKLHLPIEEPKGSSDRKNWAVAMSVNSGAGAAFSNSGGSTNSQPRSIQMNDFASLANSTGKDFLDISDNELAFQNGLPYLKASEGYSYDHKLPISFGLSVRKNLTSSISLETGLTYTYLSSDIHKQGESGNKVGEQKLHYLGIPLKVNWSFVNTNKFNVYVSGGGAVEKCVHGKTMTKSNTVKPLQFSLAGGVGAQYNITKKLGIYAEPGVAYYFDDGSDTETIRKEKKFNINLQAGLRLTY